MDRHKTKLQNQERCLSTVVRPQGGTGTGFEARVRNLSSWLCQSVVFVLFLLACHYWVAEICKLPFVPSASSWEFPFLSGLPRRLIYLGSHFPWTPFSPSEVPPQEFLPCIAFLLRLCSIQSGFSLHWHTNLWGWMYCRLRVAFLCADYRGESSSQQLFHGLAPPLLWLSYLGGCFELIQQLIVIKRAFVQWYLLANRFRFHNYPCKNIIRGRIFHNKTVQFKTPGAAKKNKGMELCALPWQNQLMVTGMLARSMHSPMFYIFIKIASDHTHFVLCCCCWIMIWGTRYILECFVKEF